MKAAKIIAVSLFVIAILPFVGGMIATPLLMPRIPSETYVAKSTVDLTDSQWTAVDTAKAKAEKAWHEDGDYAAAVVALRDVVAIDRGDIDSWSSMAWLAWSISKDPERTYSECQAWARYSTQVMNTCVANNPSNPEAWDALAENQSKNGQRFASLASLRRAVELGGGLQAEKDYGHQLAACYMTVPALYYWNQLKTIHGNVTGIGSGVRKARAQGDRLAACFGGMMLLCLTSLAVGCFGKRNLSRSHRGMRQTITLAN